MTASASQLATAAKPVGSASGLIKAPADTTPSRHDEPESKPRFVLFAFIAAAVLLFMIGVGISARRIVDSRSRPSTGAPR
jgi:hypothetical protein